MKVDAKSSKLFRLTEFACEKLCQMLSSENFLRLSIASGGCGGFQYEYNLDNNINDTDIVLTDNDRILLLIDNDSFLFVNGGVMDYVDTIEKSGFSVINPNISKRCSCGNSFSKK